MTKKQYGSGNFGNWEYDEYGLPRYHYTCNQYEIKEKLPIAGITYWSDYRDHYSQIGNDRIIALPSNFGYVRIRQDEGTIKYLNNLDRDDKQYAGGFGYFVYNGNCLSTYYEQQKNFERYFGSGYFRKETWDDKIKVTQNIFAPYGDEPCLISEITIKNLTGEQIDGNWIEYWGAQMHQLATRFFFYAEGKKIPNGYIYKMRKEFSKNFKEDFQPWNNGTVLHRTFTGFEYPKKDGLIPSIEEVNAQIHPGVGDATFEDLEVPDYYVVCLNDNKTTVSHDGQQFFANDNMLRPTGIDVDYEDHIKDSVFLKTEVSLPGNEEVTLRYLIGYESEKDCKEELYEKYRKCSDTVFAETCKAISKDQTNIILDEDDADSWISRELSWHNYFLESSVSFDKYIGHHTIHQAGFYLYLFGFGGISCSDEIFHIAPFIYSNPALAKDCLMGCLSTIDEKGRCRPESGNGVVSTIFIASSMTQQTKEEAKKGTVLFDDPRLGQEMPDEERSSNAEIGLLYAVTEYITATKDYAFLDEEIPYFITKEKTTVKDLLIRIYEYFINTIGLGKHGLSRSCRNDFSRIFYHHYYRELSPEDRKNGPFISESTYTTGLAIYSIEEFAKLADSFDQKLAGEMREYAKGLRKALAESFNGKWIPRAWISDDYGYIGDENEFMMEGQPWALITESLSKQQADILIANMRKYVMDPSPIGAVKQRLMPNVEAKQNDGWIWWALNGPLSWGLVPYDSELAYEEYIKNSLARHADVYPDVWFGIWTNSDNYTSFLSEYPGYSRWIGSKDPLGEKQRLMNGEKIEYPSHSSLDFPGHNMHAHCWSLYIPIKFLKPSFDLNGIELTPSLPKKHYEITSYLLGYCQRENEISGWYNPVNKGQYKIVIHLDNVEGKPGKLTVNKTDTIYNYNGSCIEFTANTDDERINWRLQLQ